MEENQYLQRPYIIIHPLMQGFFRHQIRNYASIPESVLTQESSLMKLPPLGIGWIVIGRSGKADDQRTFLEEEGSNWDQGEGTVFHGKLLSFLVRFNLLHHYHFHMSHTLRVKWPSFTTHSPRPLMISIGMPPTLLLTLFETFSDKNILQLIIRHKPPALLNPIPPFWYHVIPCLTSPIWRINFCLVPSHSHHTHKNPIHHN